MLKPGGYLVSPPPEERAGEHGISARFVAVQPDGAQLAEIPADGVR